MQPHIFSSVDLIIQRLIIWLVAFLKLIMAPEPEDRREEMKGGETQISWCFYFISR